jgi:excisionase family DNA binding protein
METTKQYLEIKEVIEIFRLSKSTVRRRLKDPYNPMPANKIGGRIRINTKELKHWLNQNKYI